MEKITKNKSAPSQKISAIVGEIFEITLESMEAAGYEWRPYFDPLLLRLKTTDHLPPVSSNVLKDKLIGGPGVVVFTFEALSPGFAIVHLIHQRPWEATFIDERHMLISITPQTNHSP